ncbi:polysaccharide biosynthesis protein [Bryobacter aggregatus]|uniref:polysaccharide biosynthesis protein n=1 Tax=Bryobacter aggregatus TaxID=360054 RepID=UPI000566EE3A|nr:polysaccharide biosynthesis protein [Bryobacter aggregatus]
MKTTKTTQRLALSFLIFLSAVSYLLAFELRFEFHLSTSDWASIAITLPVLVVLRLLGFVTFDINRRPASTGSFADFAPLVSSIALSSLGFSLVVLLLLQPLGISRAVILIEALLSILTGITYFSLARVTSRVKGDLDQTRERAIVVLGEEPIESLKAVFDDPRFLPVGFVSTKTMPPSSLIFGVPYLGAIQEVLELAKRHRCGIVVIAYPSLQHRELLHLTRKTIDAGLEYVLLRSGRRNRYTSIPLVDEVGIEVLLQREEVGIHYDQLKHFIEHRPVLVTGAGGSIGGELSRQLAALEPSHLYLLDHSENCLFFILRELKEKFPKLHLVPLLVDITDEHTLREEFELARPELVFHAAAHKHVGMMEARPQAALRNNLIGTTNVALAAAAVGVDRMINISTDKAVRPTSFMGLSKRLAEMVISELNERHGTHFVTVRFGNVAGSNGSVVQLFDQELRQSRHLHVTDRKATRFFMSIPEAVRLVLQAGAFAETGGIFMLEMGAPVNIYELAHTMIRLSGQRPGKDIKIHLTGLTAAEKMNEELNDDGEIPTATAHPRILGIQPTAPSRKSELVEQLPRWRHLLAAGKHLQVFEELPGYWPATTQITIPAQKLARGGTR